MKATHVVHIETEIGCTTPVVKEGRGCGVACVTVCVCVQIPVKRYYSFLCVHRLHSINVAVFGIDLHGQ